MFAAYCRLLQRLAEDEPGLAAIHLSTGAPAGSATCRACCRQCHSHPAVGGVIAHPFRPPGRATPAAVGGGGEERTLTYGELYRRARGIGGWLRERGAGRNKLVAVVMEKGSGAGAAGVLGVLESGAAYLPIDVRLPGERIAYLLQQGEVELAVTQSWVEGLVSWPEHIRRLAVDGEVGRVEGGPSGRPLSGGGEAERDRVGGRQEREDLAYVIYTSGSTGQPKGVMIDHGGAVNTLVDINGRFGVGPEDRVLAVSSLSFDLSVYDIFGLLGAGGTVVMPEAGRSHDVGHWVEVMEGGGVTVWNSVPALAEMLVEELERRGLRLPGLRLVLLSGDWIPLSLPGRLRGVAPGAEVISLGGATEASIWSILYRIGEVEGGWRSIPYGRPLANQSWQVLDEGLCGRGRCGWRGSYILGGGGWREDIGGRRSGRGRVSLCIRRRGSGCIGRGTWGDIYRMGI